MPRPTSGHLGIKLRRAIEAKGVSQAEVARAFGVSPATVSKDWIKYGRIHKKHYPLLVEFFRLPYEWWFGEAYADPQIEAVIMVMLSMTQEQKEDTAQTVLQKKSGGQSGTKKAA